MNLAPSKDNAVFFAVFAAMTGMAGALAPIFGGYLVSVFTNIRILNLTGLKLLFLCSSILRLSTVLLLRRVRIINNATIREVFAKLNNWHQYMPLYNMSRFSIMNINHRGNIVFLMTRGMLNMERILEELMKKRNKSFIWFKKEEDQEDE